MAKLATCSQHQTRLSIFQHAKAKHASANYDAAAKNHGEHHRAIFAKTS